jgi:serine/threonine protein phosphatase PrpC
VSSFLQRLLIKKGRRAEKPTLGQQITQPLPETKARARETVASHAAILSPPQLIVGCGQSVGRQRNHNEDALFTLTSSLISNATQVPFGFYIVADGMGGHKHGEVASEIAVRAMANTVIQRLYALLFSLPPQIPEQSLQEIMQEGVKAAHQAIRRQAPGGGTTLTACLVLGEQILITHVGDSRAYLIESTGQFQVLTRDHSLVKRLEELGQITPEQAAMHPQRNVLYRAVGQGEPFDAEISVHPLPRSAYLMLCSDGLWGVIPESEMVHLVTTASSPAQACQDLVAAANAAGGPDNITVVLVRLPDETH